MVIPPVESAYALASLLSTLAGLILVGTAVRAYVHTRSIAMMYLSLGFTFIVAATISTALSAFLIDFRSAGSLLLVENAFSAVGFVAIVYSLRIYE